MGDSKPSIEQNDSGLSYTRQSLLKPHPARMYAFMVGGKDHYRVDRDAVEQLLKAEPASKDIARANLAFVRRAASYLAAETHIRQVIDFGAGLPVDDYIHDRMPDARVVYADNDLMVLGHLGVHRPQKRLLTISGDLTEPEALLRNQQVQALIDFTEPVAIFACAVLHFIAADPAPIVARLREVMVPGSALVISHGTADDAKDAATAEGARSAYDGAASRLHPRTTQKIRSLFDGLTIVEPGLVRPSDWRPDDAPHPPIGLHMLAGVGIVPENGAEAWR